MGAKRKTKILLKKIYTKTWVFNLYRKSAPDPTFVYYVYTIF